jgi:hypothetical protein
MVFNPTETRLGLPPIGSVIVSGTDTNVQVGQDPLYGKAVSLGTIIRGEDPTLGGGEFIYLAGVASTVVGSLVVYNPVAGTTTLAPNTAGLDEPVAVAMGACTAHCYGWYQIAGVAAISRVTGGKTSPTVKIYLSSTAGSITSTAATGKSIFNAITANTATVASAATTINVLIQRPFANPAAAVL